MCVDVDILLVRMLASTLWRHVDDGTLQQFEQTLLHTLTTHVARDAGVIRLTSYLVDLINEHDTALGSLHVIVGHLEQTRQDTLHIFAHIASLSKHRSVNDGERHIQHLGDGTCQQCLSGTRRTHHDDVRLLNLHPTLVSRLLQAFVVVIYGNGEIALGLVLSDHILIQVFLDVLGLGDAFHAPSCLYLLCVRTVAVSSSHLIGLHSTILTDAAVHTCNQEFHLALRPSTEITFLPHAFLANTWSIIPYSLASSAVIQ